MTGHITRTFSELKIVVFSVGFSPDGHRLAVAGNNGSGWVAKVWDTETGRSLCTYRASREIYSVSFSPDGRWLALGIGDGTVKLWDTASELAIVVGKHDREVQGLTIHPNGHRLVSADRDGIVKLWDLSRAWLPLLALWPQVGCTRTLPLSAAAELQLVSRMETVGPPPVTFPRADGGFCNVAFSPDGRRLVFVGNDGLLTLWNAETGREMDKVRGRFRGFRGGVAFSPDGRWLIAAAEDCTVKVWDAATLAWKHNFRGHRGPIGGIAVSHSGEFLITGSTDKTVKVWNLKHFAH
jgi:WD40 repeat protein